MIKWTVGSINVDKSVASLKLVSRTGYTSRAKMNSDRQIISATYYARFEGCFLYDADDNFTDLNRNDHFIHGRPDTLLQSFLLAIIQQLQFDLRRSDITDNNTLMRLFRILKTLNG